MVSATSKAKAAMQNFKKLEEYEKSIPYKQFLSIREFLHDADIEIKKNKNDISI